MPHELPSDLSRLPALLELLRGRAAVVLAGAGCSTESGIPDYRGPDGSLKERQPIRYAEFVGSAEARARYWSRSAVGWPRMASSRPNDAHRALARLEAGGWVRGVITQNVDGLHQAAGSRRVVELHGSLAEVRCLECDRRVARRTVQERLLELNPGWAERVGRGSGGQETRGGRGPSEAPERLAIAPDGDAELPAEAARGFRVPPCAECGGTLKPDVVFFGENVPAGRVERAWRLFEEADVLLVVGSSLSVYSGRRFVYRAEKEGLPVTVVNLGPTRADDVARAKVEGRLGRVLPLVAEALEQERR